MGSLFGCTTDSVGVPSFHLQCCPLSNGMNVLMNCLARTSLVPLVFFHVRVTACKGGPGPPRPLRDGCVGYGGESPHGCRSLARPGASASSRRNTTTSPIRGPCSPANDRSGENSSLDLKKIVAIECLLGTKRADRGPPSPVVKFDSTAQRLSITVEILDCPTLLSPAVWGLTLS